VVVLTHNRRDELLRTLDRMRQACEPAVTVVVDNASRDGTPDAVAARFPDVRVVRLPDNRGAAGRNAGVAALPTPYVAFCDDDTWWEPGMLARAADALDACPRLGLITGRVLVEPGGHVDRACFAMAASPLDDVPGVPGRAVLGFLCAATMVRRRAFLDAGGFEPRFFLGGEEALLAMDMAAAGWALTYLESVTVHHQPSPRRDGTQRRRLLLRNALWCAWLRRPLSAVVRLTASAVGACARDPRLTPALVSAVAGLPWILRERRVVPVDVERGLRALERPALQAERKDAGGGQRLERDDDADDRDHRGGGER
jgi:GT2 family glycosyltransferase